MPAVTGEAGILDVCEKDPADASDCLSATDCEELTASAQVSWQFLVAAKHLFLDGFGNRLKQIKQCLLLITFVWTWFWRRGMLCHNAEALTTQQICK